MTGLAGRVALVTGAGSGIGRATAQRLARDGAIVGILGRTEAPLHALADEIGQAGGQAVVLIADVSEEAAMKAAIARLVAEAGRLDIVVANAGINGIRAPIDEIEPAQWDETVAINLRGTYLTLHGAVPHLKKAGAGAIVITSSINGTRVFSNGGVTAYACTKAAQVAMAQMLALELARFRIRVNAICPGKIATEIGDSSHAHHVEAAMAAGAVSDNLIPLTSDVPGTAEDVADLIAFLVSDQARHITGTPVWIDGAQSLLKG